jgi:hypothetical protein
MAIVPIEGDFAVVTNTNAWGQGAEAVGAGDGFYVNDPGLFIVPGREYQENSALVGRTGRLKQSTGNQIPDLSFEVNASYVGAVNRFLGAFFGADTPTDIIEGTATVGKEHLLTLDTKFATYKGLTIVTRYDTFIDEIDHALVDSFDLSWTNGERALLSFNLIGRAWENTSAINTGTELDTVTVVAPVELEDDAVGIRLADQSTLTPLGGGDIIAPSEVSFSFSRNLQTDVSSVSAPYRIKPVPGAGGFSGQMSFTLPDWATQEFRNRHDVGTLVMADVIWIGGVLPGATTEKYGWTINVPQAQVMDYDHSTGDRVGESITLEITLPTAAIAGMAGDELPHMILAGTDTVAYNA